MGSDNLIDRFNHFNLPPTENNNSPQGCHRFEGISQVCWGFLWQLFCQYHLIRFLVEDGLDISRWRKYITFYINIAQTVNNSDAMWENRTRSKLFQVCLVAWQYHAILLPNVDLSPMKSCRNRQGSFTENTSDINHQSMLQIYIQIHHFIYQGTMSYRKIFGYLGRHFQNCRFIKKRVQTPWRLHYIWE